MDSTPRSNPIDFLDQPMLGSGFTPPLPPGYDQELMEIDALLKAHTARTSIPRDLADAVYDATVGLIWQRRAPLPMASRPLHSPLRSRLAMAAAVGLALLAATIFMRLPAAGTQERLAGVLPVEVERILLEPPACDADPVGYLLETRDITYRQLQGDLEQMVHELEL